MTKKSLFYSVLRRWFPKRYIRKMIKRTEDEHREQLRAARSLPPIERYNLEGKLNSELWEWIEWLNCIEDKELIRKAKKIDVDLDEMPFPEPDQFQKPGVWKINNYGEEVLYDESRKAIRKAILQRLPEYRKEWREVIQFYAALFFGIMGMVIALVSVLRK